MLQSQKLKTALKKAQEKTLAYRYHRISNATATKALQTIGLAKGPLSTSTKKKADAYALEVLGWKGYAPWLYVYSLIAGEFKEGWLPDNFYGKIVINKIQGDYGRISNLKPLTNKIFNQDVCADIAYFINGFWFSDLYQPMTIQEVNALVKTRNTKVIYKVDESYQGRGISVFSSENFEASKVMKMGSGVLQNFLDQHDFFKEFGSSAVATIRMTTVIDTKGKASFRACFLRLGRVNHTHVQSRDQILIPVDVHTGKLYETGYFPSYESTLEHPDSSVSFKEKIIPEFDNCIALVLNLQAKMPMVRTIGWDVMVTSTNEPKIMEWNGYGSGICFSEATQGPSFKDLGWDRLRI